MYGLCIKSWDSSCFDLVLLVTCKKESFELIFGLSPNSKSVECCSSAFGMDRHLPWTGFLRNSRESLPPAKLMIWPDNAGDQMRRKNLPSFRQWLTTTQLGLGAQRTLSEGLNYSIYFKLCRGKEEYVIRFRINWSRLEVAAIVTLHRKWILFCRFVGGVFNVYQVGKQHNTLAGFSRGDGKSMEYSRPSLE